ncbi:MAG: hypothetical protein ACQEQV_06075 [Fibrobacterota bacterium]
MAGVALTALLFVPFIFHPLDGTWINGHFLHGVNLIFHEAGHIIFSPFGAIITSLGGSLMQLIIPAVFLGHFTLWRQDISGAVFALAWIGQNFIDIAPYTADARAGVMPLLGGNFGRTAPYGFHDWNFILTELNLLQHDIFLAKIFHFMGAALICTALFWGIIWFLSPEKSKKAPSSGRFYMGTEKDRA